MPVPEPVVPVLGEAGAVMPVVPVPGRVCAPVAPVVPGLVEGVVVVLGVPVVPGVVIGPVVWASARPAVIAKLAAVARIVFVLI